MSMRMPNLQGEGLLLLPQPLFTAHPTSSLEGGRGVGNGELGAGSSSVEGGRGVRALQGGCKTAWQSAVIWQVQRIKGRLPRPLNVIQKSPPST